MPLFRTRKAHIVTWMMLYRTWYIYIVIWLKLYRTLTIDGIQEIVMSYTATVYYSRDAEHFIDIFTAIYKFLCGPIRSFYMKDQIFLPFHIQCTSTCWIRTVHIPEAWKRYPFRAAPPCIGHYGRNPPPPSPNRGPRVFKPPWSFYEFCN